MSAQPGAGNFNSKLTADEVRQVRSWHAEGMTLAAMRDRLDGRVTRAALHLIVHRRTWKDVD